MTNPCQGHAAESAWAEHMKEAERLIEKYGNAEWKVGKMSEHSDDAEEIVTRENDRAALLAHIQRGAGVEVGESVTCEQCGHENWIMYGKAPAQITAADMLATHTPDHFRDAAKMVPAPAEAPMPECYVTSGGRDLFSEEQMSTYGDAREAAGYARGLKEAGRDAERRGQFLIECDDVALRVGPEHLGLCDAIDNDGQPYQSQALADEIAALRGEVKGLVSTETECDLPPRGWRCTRGKGHSGPCAAVECPWEIEIVERAMKRLRGEVKP